MMIGEAIELCEEGSKATWNGRQTINGESWQQMAEWLKELQAHRYAWAKLREDIRDEAEFAYADFDEYKYEVLGIDDADDLPNDDYRYGMERALELIDIYRPKENDDE